MSTSHNRGVGSATNPADLGVVAAAELLRRGDLSALDLLEACLTRITERNGGPPTFDGAPDAVNAWVRLYPDVARGQALAADRRLRQDGAAAPLLCGIPLALKDLYAVAGLPLTASSRVLADHVPQRDSVAWARLRDVGMVLLGHTHTHEFATSTTTEQVGNPRALDRVAGGSSGGSAAALAAGMVPAALGTDTAGSLRIPAALTGVSTVKPTHGRVPVSGVIPLARTLDHAGPMARTLADCAVVLEALASPPGRSRSPFELPRPGGRGDRPLVGYRIAVTDRTDRVRMHPDVADGLARAARACADLGADVRELSAPAELPAEDFGTILFFEAAAYHRRFAGREADYRPSIRDFVEVSRLFTSVDSYREAQRARARLTAAWEEWFATHAVDAVLEPTTPCPAPPRRAADDVASPGDEGEGLVTLTALWNMTGFPVAAFPAGVGSCTGLPVGVSLVGPRHADTRVTAIGVTLQEHTLPPLPPMAPVPARHADGCISDCP